MGLTTYWIFSSVDGFVAGEDDAVDWLYEFDPADRDFSSFLGGVGAVAMGSSTYESVLRDSDLLEHPERWIDAHGDRPAWVFTRRDLPVVPGANLIFARDDVRPVHQAMVAAAGDKDVFIAGGGSLAAAFADAGLLDRVVVGIAPVMLGAGKPLYTGRLKLTLRDITHQGQFAYLTYTVK